MGEVIKIHKHAFLIMAYDDIPFLIEILKALDDSRNDIYIHIDKRTKFEPQDLIGIIKKGKLIIVSRQSVTWGSEDQISVEIKLLEESTRNYNYDYYHLISGHDFPLLAQNEFHAFFDSHFGMQFIDCRYNNIEEILFRIRYYFPFQCFSTGKSVVNKVLNKLSIAIQKIVQIDRTKKNYIYGYGANWFSITDELARYVVASKKYIKENFYCGLCADEMFLQTIWLNSPIYDSEKMYINENDFSALEQNCRNALRAVDFLRGTGISPCIFDENDFNLLINSGCVFARKLDSKTSLELVKKIQESW